MSSEEPIIDVWMQHPSPRFLDQPMFESLRRWLGPEWKTDFLPPEHTLQTMEEANVRYGFVSAWHGPTGWLIQNDEVAALVAQYPDRLFGMAAVNLLRPMEAVKELRRCVKTLGFRALRVIPWLWNLPPNDRRYYPLYAECCELGIPFCTQIGHTGPLCPSEPGRPIPYLDEVALDFPELVIIAGHVGFPWTNEAISLAMKYPNVYLDTSAYKATRYPRELVEYLRGNGRKKVLFASNYPMLTPAMCLENIGQLDLEEEARQRFLYANAAHIFALPQAVAK